jgi:riboflavin synthase
VQFDVGGETLRVTTLGEFRPGRRVNIELPVRADTLLGGHIVQGHVDAIGAVVRVESGAGGTTLEISVPPAAAAPMVMTGSVAVDGVSLTISRLGADSFEVYLIPHTLKSTTLGEKDVGDRVNIECDILGKYVARTLEARRGADEASAGGVTDRLLEEHGFK